jgi:hypothetical protein
MPDLIRLAGRVEGGDSEYWFCLPVNELRRLAASLDAIETAMTFRVGEVNLNIKPSSIDQFIITGQDANSVAIIASQSECRRLAHRLAQVADAPEAFDYLSHVHLDNWITASSKSPCDIVFQRIDHFNP